jgi:hypothetical protein
MNVEKKSVAPNSHAVFPTTAWTLIEVLADADICRAVLEELLCLSELLIHSRFPRQTRVTGSALRLLVLAAQTARCGIPLDAAALSKLLRSFQTQSNVSKSLRDSIDTRSVLTCNMRAPCAHVGERPTGACRMLAVSLFGGGPWPP